jgi:hypothetical protein
MQDWFPQPVNPMVGRQVVYGTPEVMMNGGVPATGYMGGIVDGMWYVILPDNPGVIYITGGAPLEGAHVAGDEDEEEGHEAEDSGHGEVRHAAM